VFLNLVVNAAQAVETGGHVLVATRTDGDHVVVSVADDGCGIPAELIERIFDPFFTTKAVGEGTGLGLAIAHQIVTSHGGEIQVESSPGRGTVFRVRLPAASA
jgi:two-component system, NtrC family, sensor kinase